MRSNHILNQVYDTGMTSPNMFLCEMSADDTIRITPLTSGQLVQCRGSRRSRNIEHRISRKLKIVCRGRMPALLGNHVGHDESCRCPKVSHFHLFHFLSDVLRTQSAHLRRTSGMRRGLFTVGQWPSLVLNGRLLFQMMS